MNRVKIRQNIENAIYGIYEIEKKMIIINTFLQFYIILLYVIAGMKSSNVAIVKRQNFILYSRRVSLYILLFIYNIHS